MNADARDPSAGMVPPGVRPARIWVVEDEQRVLAGIVDGLARAGHAARGFDDPLAARAALDGEAPDLLLTDVLMPGMNGGELAEAARALHPHLPVLLMSGDTGATDEALLAPFTLLEKPFTLPALLAAVANALA